ncbi:hypothetical protein CHLNCDRAFT_48551 [Chlorella variabilis]|uniref:DEAD-box ATP-dependent RNA helicase 36 n=1 Tax=Chlorella variabilis TaxID=554065 RepID=E1Z627_CHLVA|nr:hypothetical protein CHLNCDRAFT_48551 [Chlorella variabilis]EFN58860.1 hypothetical protein CHLNCDRAFT_48551 [Chlorella variabilis]|eukprot:XP_005850962.1 hypothetical protein CHLNCDRAFT_48551 [Chlorella variabilis]
MREPTQVQRGTIPAVLAGRNVIGVAHTGSGKTAAFALPILQKLAKNPFGVFALVLTPTRELAFQLADQFRALGTGMSLKDCVVVGGLDMTAQAKELARRPHVVIATPGRLRGLLQLDGELARVFGRARFLVLDEADRLLEPSFESELAVVLGALPERRQTLLFSATMTQTLVELQKQLLRDAYHFQAYEGLQTAAKLRQEYLFLPAKVKEVYLVHLLGQLEELQCRSAIIFAGTCKGCHLLSLLLEELGIAAAALHSHKPQRARLEALHRFKSGSVPILLATDVASRGLDIPSVDLVVNYDLPQMARDYVHRVGRTARAGRRGWSLSFVTQYDIDLVQQIEVLVGQQLGKFELEEAEALKGITKVYSAKRAAALRVAEEEQRGRGGGAAAAVAAERKRKKRKQAAAA